MKTVRQSMERLAPMYEMIASESGERGSSGFRSCVNTELYTLYSHTTLYSCSLTLTLFLSLKAQGTYKEQAKVSKL